MNLRKQILLLLLFFIPFTHKGNTFLDKDNQVNILEKGAIADGVFNNHAIIQKTVDSLANAGGGTIYFPKGNYAIYTESIAIWGDNITLKGENPLNTYIIKKGGEGYFGDCIDICGKIKGYQYLGNFGKGNYKKRYEYKGETISANNITISNLTITTNLKVKSHVANNLGILNSNNVFINNCRITKAPQTNVAIVNVTDSFKNGKIEFTNCSFENSLRHSVRVISYNTGNHIGNDVTFNKCNFINVDGADDYEKELKGNKVHLWYRGGVENGKTKLNINDCYIDNSGIIFANSNANGLTIKNSTINTAVQVQHSYRLGMNPNIQIENNRFIANEKFKTDFIKERFNIHNNIYIYPKAISTKILGMDSNTIITSKE